jgi:hypothetical protein
MNTVVKSEFGILYTVLAPFIVPESRFEGLPALNVMEVYSTS